MDVLRYSMSFTPLLLYRRKVPQRMDDHSELRKTDPYLQTLFAQVLLKTFDESHPTWRMWSTQLYHLQESSKSSASHISLMTNADFLRNTPFRNATPTDVGVIFVRHLNHIAHTCTTLSPHELRDVKYFFSTLFNEDFHNHPILSTGVAHYAVPALVNVISALLHKRKSLKIVHQNDPEIERSNDVECQDAYYIVDRAIQLLRILLRGLEVSAVEAGIFNAIFRSFPCFYRVKRYFKEAWVGDLDRGFRNILEGVAAMLVYPPVLRCFLRTAQRIEKRPQLEEKMQRKWPAFWENWQLTKNKASLRDFYRRTTRERGISVCDCSQCPDMKPDSQGAGSYLRCAGCLSVVYCSHDCRKKDWKAGHRMRCLGLAKLRREGNSPVSAHNVRLFRLCVRSSIWQDAHEINLQVETYLSEFSPQGNLSEDGRLLRDGLKNPIVILDFHAADVELPVPQVMDMNELFSATKPAASKVLQQWRDARVVKGNILVIGFFPQSSIPNGPWLVVDLYEYPIRTSQASRFEDEVILD
ncbi:hypothetical protein PM082_014759 [Marasmius tenuissimus]|nr:hypothetical protein PM082_014759 [Marasmius tenuissimus]